ncbi:MAG TPA: hypothetical protein VM580_00890, partial [Labilithrix sp.]|nr:hypothetical protein [Labilithrix sp.]
ASELPVAAVLGLEKVVGGTMLSWATGRGHVAMSFEAGQHEDPAARERHVSALWLLLVAAAAIDAERVPALEAHRAALAVASSGSRRIVEIRHRHVVGDDDEFEMVGKFETFETIEAGQIVARDRRGPVRSPESGLMLMPRYQGQGDDGFFVAREVSPADRTR